jgi:hypothetical protein
VHRFNYTTAEVTASIYTRSTGILLINSKIKKEIKKPATKASSALYFSLWQLELL